MGNDRWTSVLTRGASSAIVLIVVAGVAGCGGTTSAGGSSGATSTSVTTSSSSVSSSSPTSSVSSTPTAAPTGNPALGIKGLPDAAKQKTTDGAIAFVKYYVSVINYSYQHPQVGLLEPFALDSCKTCDRWEQSVQYLVNHRQHLDTDVYAHPTRYYLAANSIGTGRVDVGASFDPNVIHWLDESGSPVRTENAAKQDMVLPLEWQSGGWTVIKAQNAQS